MCLYTRVAREGKERQRLWAQRKTPRTSKASNESIESEPHEEEVSQEEVVVKNGMLPNNIVNLLAAREKQTFSSDSEEEKIDEKALVRKKKRNGSGAGPVILNEMQAVMPTHVRIIDGGAELEHHATMKFLIVVTVIMRQRFWFALLGEPLGDGTELWNNIDIKGKSRHDLPRHQIQQVICSLCGTEQEARQICINCGVCMAAYFCKTCKLYDDDTSKKQYHCNGCGICRIGGCENFFHCYKCDSHPCIEGAMHHDCPVCFEYLFESRYDVSVLPCGHTIHVSCLKEIQEHLQYACPLCSKSVCDMSKVWEKLDMEIAATPMPESSNSLFSYLICCWPKPSPFIIKI